MTCEHEGCTADAVTKFTLEKHLRFQPLDEPRGFYTSDVDAINLRRTFKYCGDHGRELIAKENMECRFVSMSPLS